MYKLLDNDDTRQDCKFDQSQQNDNDAETSFPHAQFPRGSLLSHSGHRSDGRAPILNARPLWSTEYLATKLSTCVTASWEELTESTIGAVHLYVPAQRALERPRNSLQWHCRIQ